MTYRSIALAGALLTMLACGAGSGAALPASSTAGSVSVQPGDLPSGMVKCDLTGSIDSFLAKEKTADPTTYNSTTAEWNSAKDSGATAAYVAFYADSASHCTTIKTSGSQIGTATYKVVVNFVVEFKDVASATKAYTSDSVFGFSVSQFKGGGVPLVDGTATGLTANSLVLSASVASQAFYIAVWQNKTFMVILALLNNDATTGKKVALAENSRIK
ncbi:MAG TPA: hypothetical protein VGG90_06715 [Candidatus Dormibacteraeota bacterium]